MVIKKPPICQAGSAEAFVDSTATGRERINLISFIRFRQQKNFIDLSQTSLQKSWDSISP